MNEQLLSRFPFRRFRGVVVLSALREGEAESALFFPAALIETPWQTARVTTSPARTTGNGGSAP